MLFSLTSMIIIEHFWVDTVSQTNIEMKSKKLLCKSDHLCKSTGWLLSLIFCFILENPIALLSRS